MAVPNIQTRDLTSILLQPSSNPTSDVKFTFVNQTTGESSELAAHKLVLACASEVFMAQFYSSIKEQKDLIPVTDSSVEAFQVFLTILYNKEVNLKGMDFQFLGELFYLAEKHHLNQLQDAIVEEVSSRLMIREKLLESAKVAESFSHLERFSDSILQSCSHLVKENIELILEIFAKEEVGDENSCTLHRLMAMAYRTKTRSRPDSSYPCPLLKRELILKEQPDESDEEDSDYECSSTSSDGDTEQDSDEFTGEDTIPDDEYEILLSDWKESLDSPSTTIPPSTYIPPDTFMPIRINESESDCDTSENNDSGKE